MGKSTVAAMFASMGCPVFDADAAVRDYYRSDGAAVVERAFPGVVEQGAVDRDRLGAKVLGNASALSRLEAIVHPAVAERRVRFLTEAGAVGRRIVFLDVPLLFETGGDGSVELVVVVSAASDAQRKRALRREGMTPAKFDAILLRQMPDSEKRRRSHYVIDTNGALEESRAQAAAFVRAIVGQPGRVRNA